MKVSFDPKSNNLVAFVFAVLVSVVVTGPCCSNVQRTGIEIVRSTCYEIVDSGYIDCCEIANRASEPALVIATLAACEAAHGKAREFCGKINEQLETMGDSDGRIEPISIEWDTVQGDAE